MVHSVGMLSKSKGQILRVSACLHVLFHIETPTNIPDVISTEAIKAAIDMVDVCLQHAAYLAGRGDINEMIQEMAKGNSISTSNMCWSTMFSHLTSMFPRSNLPLLLTFFAIGDTFLLNNHPCNVLVAFRSSWWVHSTLPTMLSILLKSIWLRLDPQNLAITLKKQPPLHSSCFCASSDVHLAA